MHEAPPTPPNENARGRGRSLAIVVLVAAAAAVVAVSAAGTGALLQPMSLDDAGQRTVRAIGALAVIGGLAGLLVQRRREGPVAGDRQDPTVAALLTTATIMGTLAMLALLTPGLGLADAGDRFAAASPDTTFTASDSARGETRTVPRPPRREGLPGMGGAARGPTRGGAPGGGPVEEPVPESTADDEALRGPVSSLLLAVLLLAAAVIGLLYVRRRLQRAADLPPDGPVAAEDAEASLEASLVEVAYDGPDPRRQITAAYQRLLAALSAAGVPRRPQEAPHEHLERALGPLGIEAAGMHRLAELYVVAQFTNRPVGDRDRAAAAAALEGGLASLRARHALPDRAGAGA